MALNGKEDEINNWGKTLLVISGASRGLGAGICEVFASQMAPDSVIIGMARSLEGLQKTVDVVKEINPAVKFLSVKQDLSKSEIKDLRRTLETSLADSERNFSRAILVHNAGSLGKLDYVENLGEENHINDYFQLNVSSLFPLTTAFMQVAKTLTAKPKLYVINISSLCAVSPIRSWGLYCAGKAARNMVFKVLAEENKDITVLNYAPGPLDNDMQVQARSETKDPEIKDMFESMKKENKLLQVQDSAKKLVQVLNEGNFSSGDHVDYFD